MTCRWAWRITPMSDIDWVKDVPAGAMLVEMPPDTKQGSHGAIVIDRRTFERIGHYEWGYPAPTAPSDGRIYRRGDWLFIVKDDPADPKFQYHHPCIALIIEEPARA